MTTALAIVALAACSSPTDQPGRGTDANTPRADTGANPGADPGSANPGDPAANASASGGNSPGGNGRLTPRAPLVLAIHPTRPPLNLTQPTAQTLIDGRLDDWADLGAPPAPLKVVAGPEVQTAVAKSATDEAALSEVAENPNVIALVPASAIDPTVKAISVDGVHPLRSPGRYALTTPGVRPAGAPVTITIVGDIMLGRSVGRRHASNPGAPLAPTARRLAAADITVGNLESTLSQAGRARQGDDSFAADPRVLDGLKAAGFDVLDLANNHTGDFGERALVETVQRVRNASIQPLGAGADLAQASRPVIAQHAGVRVGFLAFNAIGETPRAGPDQPGAVSLRMEPRTGPLSAADLAAFEAQVRALHGKADFVIVLPHWGLQYTNRPVADQRRVARALIEAGADLIIGGHPHWVQGLEIHNDRLIAYSLGNFIFDMQFMKETQEGVFAEVVLWGDRVCAVELVPYRLGRDFTPRLVPWVDAGSILNLIWDASGPPFTASRR